MTAIEHQARSIFLSAVDRPADQWPAFLDEACGDNAELRARVDQLLRDHEAMGSIHGRSEVAVPTLDEPLTEQPGAMIGRYKLIEQIGEGGMGTVWMAQQTEPVKRLVAVKLIKAGMDSKQVLARFEAERQALALMDHPNIAKVLDAGAAPDGRPYFVMELVKGVPITKHCDQQRLTPRQRLELFFPVCQAIQHAHQKGIIHRDIKPSNVLVALYDDKPVPKVIDFGVAKAAGQQLTDQTLVTGFGSVVGTLEYMSPEQAHLNQLDIDTRSDVYSLGVLLYELLTGSTPLDRKRLKQAAFAEMLRIIREDEPPKPSTRLSESKESLPSVSAQRHTEPAKLTKLVRGELDWIVMKALEKDRSRRYETANGFAMDIQRYLADEPVLASPPSARYRLRKFVKRNRPQVVAGLIVLATLLAGMAGTTWGLFRAEAARKAERARAESESQARKQADIEKARAEKAEIQTLAAFQASTDEAIEQLIGSKSKVGAKERAYLENTLKRWQAFAARQENDQRGQAIRADGHFRIGSLWTLLDEPTQARVEFEKACEIQQRLIDQGFSTPELHLSLAKNHNNLAILLEALGEFDAARAEYELARDLGKKLAQQFPDDPAYAQHLARTHNNMCSLLAQLGERDAAVAQYEAALTIQKKLVEQHLGDPAYHSDLASTFHNLAYELGKLGNADAAQREFGKAREIETKLVEKYPTVQLYQERLANTHSNLGNVLTDVSQWDAAQAEYAKAWDIYKKLADTYPAVPRHRDELGKIHYSIGRLLTRKGNLAEARAEFEKAIALRKPVAEQVSSVPAFQESLAAAHNALGVTLINLHQFDAARAEFEKGLALQSKLVERYPNVPNYVEALAFTHNNLGILFTDLGQREAAQTEFEKAIAGKKHLAEKYPTIPSYQVSLGGSHCEMAQWYRKGRQAMECLTWCDQAIAVLAPVYRAEPRDINAKHYLASSHENRALVYVALSKYAEALPDWDKALELSSPEVRPEIRARRISSRVQTGHVLEAIADAEELTKMSDWRPVQWYDFACAYAVAAGKYPDQKQVYGDRAMELLRIAVKNGWNEAAHMAKDSDMDALRNREDYKKLIAEMESAKKP